MIRIEHLVAHTRGGDRSLAGGERARWLWARLRAACPAALAMVLMPDHVHLVGPAGLLARLRAVLSAFTARFGVRFDLLPPQPAHSRAIALRMVRYVLLNPVREGLVDDPWSWPWSTLRDLGGAVASAWTHPREVARALGLPPAQLVRRLTRTADAEFRAPEVTPIATVTLDAARAAAASALRVPFEWTASEPHPRRVVIQLLYEIGEPKPSRLAIDLGCTIRTIQRGRQPRDPALAAARLCLGDPRLLVHDTPERAPVRHRAAS